MVMGIAQFANTFVGKRGNIGVRTAKVLARLERLGVSADCVCRGATVREMGSRYHEMGYLGHASRVLNAVRMYLLPEFNHRPLDIRLFEDFAIGRWRALQRDTQVSLAHVWDTCPRLINQLNRDGARVLLDVPIAPLTYGRRLRLDGRADFLLDDQRLIDIELASYERADHLIAPSDFVAEELVLAGVARTKISVVQFGVDAAIKVDSNFIRNTNTKAGVDFCMVGAIGRRKGTLELLDVWQHHDFKNDRLHLCGRVYPEVKSRVARSHSGEIYLPGFVEPMQYLTQCDVFVFPSWLEGSAKAVFEAMACGLPAIVTKSSGSIVRDGIDGFVIEAGDTSALRDRMLWFKSKPEQIVEMGASARERARAFTWTRYADRVLELYYPGVKPGH